MNPLIASLVYTCGIAGLFYLDRDKSIKTSVALWLPVLYLWILGSRPVSTWLSGNFYIPIGTDIQSEGNPVDAAFFGLLLIAAIGVLVYRGSRALAALNANFPILIFFSFCLLSVSWSDYTGVALKRWIKAIGDLAMIFIVITDREPVAALRRLLSRTGFILVPLSLLFIKYFPYLGRAYDPWTGAQINTGLTDNKNTLGVITFVIALGAAWRVLELLWSEKRAPDRNRHLLAQGTLLALGLSLLVTADSATSLVCFFLGAGLMLATGLRFVRRHPAAVHVLVVLLIVAAGSVMLLGGEASAIHALGRNTTLTGRTDIWAAVIPLAPNALIGAGFESFWLSPLVHERLWEAIPGLPLNEAHNGYIEVYLQLGWAGLCLLGLLLFDAYRRSVKAFRRDPRLGGLLIAYTLTAMVYSVTEAGFRMMDPMWIFFLLAVTGASSIAPGVSVPTSPLLDGAPAVPALRAKNVLSQTPARRTLAGKSRGGNQPDFARVRSEQRPVGPPIRT